jgi:hypothetical protein
MTAPTATIGAPGEIDSPPTEARPFGAPSASKTLARFVELPTARFVAGTFRSRRPLYD